MVTISSSEVRHLLSELVAKYDVPGASVSVLVGGEVLDAAVGVVDNRTGVEVRPDSPFMIQSVTKVWTATLVMQLVDEGLVALDEPATRYLPDFRTADQAASAAITIRQLLSHTGGFEGDIWAATTDDEDALRLFVDEHVAHAPQHLEPGQLFSYCSAGMGVLGRLVEVLRETTYARALRRHLTDPLGIDGVAADAGEALAFRTAIGHVSPGPGEPLRPLLNWAVLPRSNPAAGNRLAMPAQGLIRFARMHLADGVAPEGVRLLSADSARSMREPQVTIPAMTSGRSASQGLGWRLTSRSRVIEHDGGAPGCGAVLRLVPDRQVAVAALANGGEMSGLFKELCAELLGGLAGIGSSDPVAVPRDTGVGDLDRYCGRYELRNQVAEVTADESGRLWLTQTERNDAVAVAALAGVGLEAETTELRRADGETFLRLDRDGLVAGAVEFIDTGGERARYLHDGRAAPRVG